MRTKTKIALLIGISVVFVISVISVGFVISEIEQRKTLEEIEISFHEARLKDIGFRGATLDLSLNMYNPNDITATLDRAVYDLWFNDNYLGSGETHQRLDIPPLESKIAKTDFDLSFEGAGRSIISAITLGEVSWRIEGIAYYDTPIGTIEIPFDITK